MTIYKDKIKKPDNFYKELTQGSAQNNYGKSETFDCYKAFIYACSIMGEEAVNNWLNSSWNVLIEENAEPKLYDFFDITIHKIYYGDFTEDKKHQMVVWHIMSSNKTKIRNLFGHMFRPLTED